MSEPTTPNEREAFERWHKEQPGYPYAGVYLNFAWKAWQAAAAQRTDPAVASTAAVPEGAEAVAVVVSRKDGTRRAQLLRTGLPFGTKLFAHPPRESGDAERQPLTDAQIQAWWASENGLEDADMCKLNDFRQVVRAVEAKHGIRSAAYQGKEA